MKPPEQPDAAGVHQPQRPGECSKGSHHHPLLEVCADISGFKRLDELLDTISFQLRRAVPCDGVLILLPNDDARRLEAASMNFGQAQLASRFAHGYTPPESARADRVLQTGVPLIDNGRDGGDDADPTAGEPLSGRIVNQMHVPVTSFGHTVGVLVAINKQGGDFHEADVALFSAVAGIAALAMENLRLRKSLADYRRQMRQFNRAKDRVIHQLSHALKTPLAVLIASLKLLKKPLNRSTDNNWRPAFDRAQRNLARLLTIEYEMEDILRHRTEDALARMTPMPDSGEPCDSDACQRGNWSSLQGKRDTSI